MAKKGVVKDWTKNAASAIKYTAVDLTSDSAPFLTNTISSAASAIKDMVDWIKRNSPEKNSNSNKEPFLKRAINSSKDTFKLAMSDIKAGNLNFDGLNKKFSNSMGDMFDDFDFEPDFDFGDESDLYGDSESDSDGSSSSFEGLTGEMYASGLEVSTRANIDAIAESSSYISENTMRAAQASTKQMVAANFANTARLSSQLSDIILNTKATNDNVASLVEFNNNSMSPFLSQAQQYMENTEQTLNDIKAILETRMLDPTAEKESYSPRDLIRGGIDVKGYLKKASNSMFVQMGLLQFSPIISMLSNMGVPMPDFIKDNSMIAMGSSFNPLKSIAKYTLPSLFGEKSKLKDIDMIFEDLALKIADKIYRTTGFDEFGQKLVRSTSLDRSKYEQGAVVWSGKDSKVLQDVIPNYLSHIELNTEKTVKNLNDVVDILHRTLMGKNGMIHAYDDYGGLLRDERGFTYYDKLRMKNGITLSHKNFAKAPEVHTFRTRQYKDKLDENGNPVLNKDGSVKRVRDADLVVKKQFLAQKRISGEDAKNMRAKTDRIVKSNSGRRKKETYDDITVYDTTSGEYKRIDDIKHSFELELTSAYEPFSRFFDLLGKIFDLNADPDFKRVTAEIVSKWANKYDDFDSEKIVDLLIDMMRYNTLSEEPPTALQRSTMVAALRKAKIEFIKNRSEIFESINSGQSVYKHLNDQYLKHAKMPIEFSSHKEFTESMIYGSGDKDAIAEYEKKKKLEEKFKNNSNVPFDKVLSDEEFIDKYGEYDDATNFFEKVAYVAKNEFNSAKGMINDIAISLQNSEFDKSSDKMLDWIFNTLFKGYVSINDLVNGDGKSDADKARKISNILGSTASEIKEATKRQAETGARRIPNEGWWLLHPNERVLTAEEADEYDEFMRMLRNGELVNAFTADPVKSEAIRKMNNWYNNISVRNSTIDYSKYDDLRSIDQSKLEAEVTKRYGAGAKIAGIFNDGKEAIVQKADGKLARLLYRHGKYQIIDETSTDDDFYDLASMGKKKAGRKISKLFGDKNPVVGFSEDGRSAITKDKDGKYHEYKIRRRKPQNADEEKNLEAFTNKGIEKAETREDVQFEMQREMTENIRSIAATTAGEADRSIKRDKADNADETKTLTKSLLGKLSGFLFGEKDDNGFFTDGPFANIANKVVNSKRKLFHSLFGKGYVDIDGNVVEGKDVVKGAKDAVKKMTDSASETLFGKKKNTENSDTPTRVSPSLATHDKVPVYDDDGNPVLTPTGKQKFKWVPKDSIASDVSPISDAINDVAEEINEAGQDTINAAFGEDAGKKVKAITTRTNKEVFADYAKKLGKGALIGGIAGATLGTSLGVIPSMFIPGGPIAGALLGLGGSIISQTETFKRFVFGDIDSETGEREGGLISKNMQERFKKVVPFVAGGAALGLLQKFFLPAASLIPGPGGALMNIFFGNGPIAGALLGLGGGLLASSETFRKKIFGEKDEDGELYGGILSKPAEAIRKFFKKHNGELKGAGIGALAGLVGNKLAAAKFGSGLLYKVFGAGGPIGAAIIGSAVGIAIRSEKFQEMMFGRDTGEVDEHGRPIRDKSGLLNKFMNVFEINVIRPLAEWGEYARDSFVNWLKHDLGDHIKGAFKPLQDALQDGAEAINDMFDGLGTKVATMIGMLLHPVKKMLPALLRTGVKLGTGVLTGSAKMVGGMISAPFKTLDFIMNASPGGNPGGKFYKDDNARFRKATYGEGFKGDLKNWADFMFNRDSWLDKRQAWGNKEGIEKDSGFFYYNKRRNAKLDKKDVTDEYKRKKGITDIMQKWAAADGYNSSVILSQKELDDRKKILSSKGVDTKGWTSQDLIDFMYSNDEKRKVKHQADEDAKLQREANQAEIETKEEIRTFKDIFIDFKNRIFNKDKVSDTNSSDNTVTEQESEKLERKIETGDSVKIGDMPSEGAKEVLSALQANDHNKDQKTKEEESKKKADAKTAEAQVLGKKKDGDKSDDEKKTFKEKVAEYVENKGGVFATITDFVGKAAGLGIAALVATKIDWSGVFKTIKGAVSGLIDGFKENTEESRTYIDEETGEEVIAPSALDAQVVVPRLANSAFRFATGTNLSALLYNITGGKVGGAVGWASSKLGKVTMNAMAKPIAKISGKVGSAASRGKFLAQYSDDFLSRGLKVAGKEVTNSEKFFAKIYRVLDKMKNSKALQSIAGSKLGKAIDSLAGAFKKISTKFGKILGKNSGKLADAAAAGAAKTGASAAKDVVPVLNIIIWSAGAIAGSLNVANLFHLSSDLDADIWMRTVAAIIGFLKSTMVGSLIDIIAEILKDAADFDLWNFIAVPCYKVFASDEQDAALDASMKAVEDACEQYNQEHGTNLSVTEYNDQIRNRTLGTKILGVFGLDKVSKDKKKAEEKATAYEAYSYLREDDNTNEDSNSSGYGTGLSSIGYGFDHYTQNDPRWGRRKYATRRNGLSTSMSTGGCGPTALANAATQLGVNVNPVQVANMARTNGYTSDGGTNARMFTDGVRQLGLRSTNIGRGGVRTALRRGQKVILSGKGSDGIYTKAGHIISARGLDSRGNAIVDDPLKRRSRRIPISKLTSNSTHAWAIGYGPDLAIHEASAKYTDTNGRPSPKLYDVSDNAPSTGSTDNISSAYYAYQQATLSSDPDRNWDHMSIYNGDDLKGHVPGSIGLEGCLLTAMASLFSNALKLDIDPLWLAKNLGSSSKSLDKDGNTFDDGPSFTQGGASIQDNTSTLGYEKLVTKINRMITNGKKAGLPFVEISNPYGLNVSVSSKEYVDTLGRGSSLLNGRNVPIVKNGIDGNSGAWGRLPEILNPAKSVLGTAAKGVASVVSPIVTGPIGGTIINAVESGKYYASAHSNNGGLYGGYPVVLFGSHDIYNGGSTHAIVLRGVYANPFDKSDKDVYTTVFDPGKFDRNGEKRKLKEFLNEDVLKKTTKIISFSGGKNDWTQYSEAMSNIVGVTKDWSNPGMYDNGTALDPDNLNTSDSGDNNEEPKTILKAASNFIGGLVKIANNIFSALGTKDFMYKSIYSDKTSSLIGGNGFNESVRDLTQGLSDASDVYGSNWTYRVPGTFSSESVGAINAMDYKNTANYLGVTPELLAAINNDAAYSTGIESQYQNIPSLPSGKLPADVLLQMKAKLFPMIARHESGGTTDSVITDTNNRVALGIGGFNASNASEVMFRLANKIDSLIAQANEAGVDNLGELDGVRENFNILAGTGSLDVATWAANSDLLRKYAAAAKLNALSTSTKNTLSKILRQSGEYAKEAQIAVLDDLLNIYMQEPIKHYNSGDLLDPRSIMLMSEFGGYGPAHLGKTAMWDSIKRMTNIYNTSDKNVNAVREGMINYYRNNVSSFTSGHATRISETASTLLDPTNSAGFVPDSIMPGSMYGITTGDDIATFMEQVYSLLNNAAADGKYDTSHTGTIVESILNTITYQYKNGGIKSTPEKLVKTEIKRYPITKSKTKPKTTYGPQQVVVPDSVKASVKAAADEVAKSNANKSQHLALINPWAWLSLYGTGLAPDVNVMPGAVQPSIGNGPGTGYYSDADIYTDEESIARYNANNPLPVKMNTKPIESRVDVVIQILRQILQVCNANKSAEGYGTKAANPIGNSQKVRNAGIDIADRMPLYTKDMNEVHVDPLRQLFQTIAASPR